MNRYWDLFGRINDEDIFVCKRCGALVPEVSTKDHEDFHREIEVAHEPPAGVKGTNS